MRKIELSRVNIADEEYPIYCDLYVFQQIQEKMDINDFERGIVGAKIIRDEDGNPKLKDNRIEMVFDKYDINLLIYGLTLMINEGLTIEAEQEGTECELVDEKYIARICDLSLPELSSVVHEAFGRCCGSKKNKVKTTKKTKSPNKNTLT